MSGDIDRHRSARLHQIAGRTELAGMAEPVVVASADKVGTELVVARRAGDLVQGPRRPGIVPRRTDCALKEDAMATQPDFFLYDRIGRLAAVIEVRNRRRTSSQWAAEL